ncbi:MAG: hypothetical protein KAH05_08590 [Clostridiales bacterium]|nr:hypothetical protein [Clostridiales bacterium]
MIKKSAFLIALLLFMNIPSFADSDFNQKIEIVSPTIGSEGDVMVVNNLYISIRIDEPVECLVKLVKIEKYEVNLEVLDKVFLNIDLTKDEKSQIYGANVARVYFALDEKMSFLQNQYNQMNTFVENVDEYELEILQREIENVNRQLINYKNEYESLFYKNILGPEPLQYEGILPYYERTISDVEDGDYKLIFDDLEGHQIEEVVFSVKSKEIVMTEIINSIPFRLMKMIDYIE